jgi:hypothetical protein
VKRSTPLVNILDDEPKLPLEMHEPIERSTRNFLNCSKIDLATIMAKRQEECYASRKVSPDPRFWALFHADGHRSVYLHNRKLLVESQWVNWDYMTSKKNSYFNQIVAAEESYYSINKCKSSD